MTTTPTAAAAGVPRQRLDFAYDSQGRRVSKTVSTSADGTTWTFASNRRFLYDGWNPIAEYSAPSETSTTLTHEASYLWGLDLSGTPQGAGGVGGLLAVSLITNNPITNNYPSYDGNGRWPSRDTIGERGGVNLYGFVGNDEVERMDLLGLKYGSMAG